MKNKFYNIFTFVSECSLYGLLFFIPISISLVEIFAGLMLISFVGRKIIKPDFKFLKFQPDIFLLLFLLFSALSLINSGPYFNISLRGLFGKWVKYAGIYVIIQDGVYDQKIIRRSVFVFLSGAALVVLSGLSQYFFGVEFLRNKSMTIMDCGWYAMTSSFSHYNSFGAYMVVVLSLAAAMLVADNCYGLKAISLLIFSIFSTVAVMFTFSRGSWTSLAISFVVVSIFAKRKIGRLIPIFLIIAAMFFLPEIRDRLSMAFKAGWDADRLKFWSAALKMIKEHPFLGIGLGTFMANFSKYLPNLNISYAHNCYLQILAETGIFSLVNFVLFVVSLIYFGAKKFLRSRDFVLLGLLSGMVGFLIHSFFEVNLYSLQLASLFWVLAGLIVARLRIVDVRVHK